MSALDDLCADLCGPAGLHEAEAPARAAILRQLADTLLYVALEAEPRDDRAVLLRLPLEEGAAALACDDDGRLAAVLGRPVAHLALPGRDLARRLAAEGLALLVNPGAPSAMLLDAGALHWLTESLAPAPPAAEAKLSALGPPDPAVVAALMPVLGPRLADMGGLVPEAVLVSAREDEGEGARALHLLLMPGARPEARPAIAKAVAELLAFMPPLPTPLDVSFDAAPLAPGAVTIRVEAEAPPPAPEAPAEPRPPRLR